MPSTIVASGPSCAASVPVLRAVRLAKRYGGLKVLQSVSLSAERGEVISIIGGSGSGKSTFLRCLNVLELPDEGEVWVGATRLTAGPCATRWPRSTARVRQIDRLRTRLGMVFQGFNLWSHKTVLENVTEGPVHVLRRPRREAKDEAEHLLRRVGLADKLAVYPRQLSGGQQQRVAIARALAMRPEALLLDEPTSALDPELVGDVLRVIRGLVADGMTMLIVTHELGFAAEVSSRAVFLHAGRIEEEGRTARIFREPASDRLRSFLVASR